MSGMLPVITNGTSTVTIPARQLATMAKTSMLSIEAGRESAVRKLLKECMEEECVYRIPILGIPYHRHKRYPNTDIAMRFAPEIQHAQANGWGDYRTCEQLLKLAEWMVQESGFPEEQQVANVTLNDFSALI